ncbi:Cytochrome P450 CYP2 subfamily [Rasamsonia emersonii CBS 393.64]|uniref:Cytochrome P450 CYP2 subfamily n=1 Tax=Rasamsonia emersonii (strain ATCC 16479 / CBS 393.64 / IMI 116815) TaxID=1408163 RepID=A0A0F4Z1N4_RASE3|nr:Cytochrome P450 CYP2 subfamily [Rasamsonia emersonii CBS 393.64]KKA24419.1 Cytochrome P450 CYP2 subfamily [Rasamsonia emersonii CBS 393.64]
MDEILPVYQSHRFTTLAVVLGIIVLLSWLFRDRRLDTIPGPKGYPLIGVGYKLPPQGACALPKIRVGWYNWVVINTPEAVWEILEKQAVNTSSKAPSPMGHDIVTGGKRMPTMPYGPHWRTQRAVVRRITTVPMTATFVPSQEFEAKQLLYDLATNNDNQRDFYHHMRRYAFSIIMTNTFGTRIKSWDHPDAQNAVRSQAILRRTSRPGAFIVDEVPPLARLPKWLQPGRKTAEAAAKEVLDIKMGLWRRLEKQLEEGKAPHCYAREILERRESWYAQGLNEEDLAWVAGGLVEAGFETSAATLNSLVLHLAANQRVQEKAQEELMRVVGPNRLPTFEDISNLPYIRACVKEMLRMNPILSPCIRHYTDADVMYKGHVIPKRTVLLANTAFLHYDPRRFEKPFEFMPERCIEHHLYSSDYAAMSNPYKRDHFTFSTGWRTCPGARLAENSLNIALSHILWAFQIRPPLVNGVEAEMDLSENAYPDAGFTIPKPFAARFVPWSEDRLRIVKEQWEIASKEGYELRGIPVDINGMVQ